MARWLGLSRSPSSTWRKEGDVARYAEHTFGAHDRSFRSPHAHRCVVASVFPLDPSESSHIDFRARVVRRRDIARRDASPFAVVVATRPGIVATLTPVFARPSASGWPSLSAPCTPLPPPRPSARPRRVASPRASPPRASRCAPWRTTLPRGLPSTSSSTCASARCSRRPSTRTPTSSTSRRSTSARRSPARSAPVSHPTWQPRSVPDPSPVAHRSPKRRNFLRELPWSQKRNGHLRRHCARSLPPFIARVPSENFFLSDSPASWLQFPDGTDQT